MFHYKAIYVIVLREFKRFFRQKGRMLVTVARPLIWLVIVGAGFVNIIDLEDQTANYMQFVVPGILGMTILFNSIFSTMSVVWDREFGFLREMLVAPVPRTAIVMGKLFSGTALSVFQGSLLLFIVAPVLGIGLGFLGSMEMLLYMTLLSFAITALGLFIAAHLTSLEGFNVIMNFIVLPMFFLSGALYPVSTMPEYMRYLTYINPMSYGVDSFRHAMTVGGKNLGAEMSLMTDIIFISVFALVMITLAARAFERTK